MKNKKTSHNNVYSLWRVNGCEQGFRFVASFGFGGQESASKPPQAICKPLTAIPPPALLPFGTADNGE
jgi:hypothetical protein